MRAEAVAAMLPFLTGQFANPSGSHRAARAARRALDDARDELGRALGCSGDEVVWTSGGTEADNLAIAGVAARRSGAVLVSAVEHRAVLAPAARAGATRVPVDARGVVDLEALGGMLREDVALVSVMAVNNELGVLEPLPEILGLARELAPGALLHTDAVQALSWCDLAGQCAGYDLVSVSAHKFGGPKGIGALVVRAGARGALEPLLRGGGQERELRAGTPNVAGAVAMAAAARATVEGRARSLERVGALRDALEDRLCAAVDGLRPTVPRAARVAGACPVLIEAVSSEELLVLLDDARVCASAGSSCASGAHEPSHVLAAIGLRAQEAAGALRLSLGETTTAAEVDWAVEALAGAVARLRAR